MSLIENPAAWFNQAFLGNPLWMWGLSGMAAILAFFVLHFIKDQAATRLGAMALKSSNKLDDHLVAALRKTHTLFLAALAVLAASLLLELGERGEALRKVFTLGAIIQAGAWATALLASFLGHWKESKSKDASTATVILAAAFLGRLVVWSAVLLLVMENLGIKVTTLLAGLGVGGIAVALAVQNILQDLFASVSIVLDKPFEIGDFIIIGDFMGTVENIGLKTTRVRSLSGEQLVISNGDLLSSRIRNYKRMQERRVVFTLGLTYDTPAEKLAAVPGLLKEIVTAQADTRFDRAHFQKYGDFSLVFEVVYFVNSADYNKHMDIQQAVNLAVYSRFEEQGIGFAYPTQTLILRRGAPP